MVSRGFVVSAVVALLAVVSTSGNGGSGLVSSKGNGLVAKRSSRKGSVVPFRVLNTGSLTIAVVLISKSLGTVTFSVVLIDSVVVVLVVFSVDAAGSWSSKPPKIPKDFAAQFREVCQVFNAAN